MPQTKFIIPKPSQVLKGAKSIVTVALNKEYRANDTTIKARRDVCRACEFATKNAKLGGLTNYSQCTKCTCIIAAKTRDKRERCPEGKWNDESIN